MGSCRSPDTLHFVSGTGRARYLAARSPVVITDGHEAHPYDGIFFRTVWVMMLRVKRAGEYPYEGGSLPPPVARVVPHLPRMLTSGEGFLSALLANLSIILYFTMNGKNSFFSITQLNLSRDSNGMGESTPAVVAPPAVHNLSCMNQPTEPTCGTFNF